jgi:hypothetical protein
VPGTPVPTSVFLSATTIVLTLGVLTFTMTGNTVAIATTAGPPAALTLNGIPVT